jgi:inositol-phosphate phosphatase / L-galactose 1-phosphate phosphatase / histidinol-phosphatase
MTQPRAVAVPGELIALAERLADISGAIIRRYFRSGVAVIDKADTSPVTIADREAEAELRRLILAAHPDHGIIGEEHGAERADAEWVLDPIDGTKSFITGRPLFGTLIALCRRGAPVLGVIDHPALGERWIGAHGHPTTMNGKTVEVRACADLHHAALFASTPHQFQGAAFDAFESVRRKAKLVQYGSDCYHYALVASGFGDIAIEAGLGMHDYLALVPVVEGAGGVITDWAGRPLVIGSGDKAVAAGDARVHAEALALLGGA